MEEKNTLQVNNDSLNKQKNDIKRYLTDELKIKKSELKRLEDDNILITEGFKIEGKKIKYEYEHTMLFSGIDYHLGNIIRNNMYIWLFNKLKGKYDVVPHITTITDATMAKEKGSFKIKTEKCKYYKAIKYIEIAKPSGKIFDIDDVRITGYGYEKYLDLK